MIEYCTQQKVNWDVWVRDERHTLPEMDFNALQGNLTDISRQWNGEDWRWLMASIRQLSGNLKVAGFPAPIDEDLLVGGFFAALVRSGAL